MEIKGVNKGYFSKVYGSKKVKGSSFSPEDILSDSDSVDISSQAKEMQKLVQEGMDIDDVRMDKVQALKDEIESGQYYVPTKVLAASIFRYLNWAGR